MTERSEPLLAVSQHTHAFLEGPCVVFAARVPFFWFPNPCTVVRNAGSPSRYSTHTWWFMLLRCSTNSDKRSTGVVETVNMHTSWSLARIPSLLDYHHSVEEWVNKCFEFILRPYRLIASLQTHTRKDILGYVFQWLYHFITWRQRWSCFVCVCLVFTVC